MKFDLIVVGSGPSAWSFLEGYMADNSSASCGKIAIIEAGPLQYDGHPRGSIGSPHLTGLPFQLEPTTVAAMGGTSNLWHGVIAPMDPEDFKPRPHITDAEWPINLSDLWPWYLWVADRVGWNAHLFHEKNWSQHLHDLMDQTSSVGPLLVPKLFLRTKPVFRTRSKFVDLVRRHTGVELYTEHKVLEVGANWLGDRAEATHVIVGIPGGKKLRFEGNKIALCAGALHSPHILLNSLPEWHREYDQSARHVGKYLMDHPMGPLFQVDWGKKDERKICVGTKYGKGQHVVAAFRLAAAIQDAERLPNSAFYLRPSPAKGEDRAAEELKLALLTVFSKLRRGSLPIKEIFALLRRPWLTWQVIQFKLGFVLRHRYSMGYVLAEQRPYNASRVELNDRRDLWGYKETNINWALHPSDVKDLEALYNVVAEQFTISRAPDFDDWRDNFSSAAHHLGTCRMSNNPKDGVVDQMGRVHGVSGLYIADGSTFVTSGNANSTFSIMANAARIGYAASKS